MSALISHLFNPLITVSILIMVTLAPCLAAVSENLLKNPSFEEGVNQDGFPIGWSLYGGNGNDQSIKVVELERGRKAAELKDGDMGAEIGLMQSIPAKPGLTYQASVEVRAIEDAPSYGAYLQLRFLPSNKYFQTSLTASSAKEFEEVSVKGTAPPDTTHARVYLYTHRDPTPELLLRNVKLVSGVSPPPPPPPKPIPPVYTKLKELYINTLLVSNGKPNITIIAPANGIYEKQARRIQEAIKKLTGVKVPIATDLSAPRSSRQADEPGAVPIKGNLIAIGNRSTNKTISELYNRYYTLLDLRYPGPEGYVVRTLHNPFGNGKNVIFVGGSDIVGVNAAANVFIEQLNKAGVTGDRLSIGWLAKIKLGKGVSVPKDLRDFKTWEASKGYGSVGYFGWNSISKRMAMYYMTGDEFQAREFIRLAFPDEKAKQEIAKIDGERIENKDEPLSGPYHYNAHMMILFWDLIEESPVFSDEERLRVTNAFSKQLNHRKGEGIYGRTTPPAAVGSRHGQWSAISLYCLGRYFQKDYPNPIWYHCVEGAKLHFEPLHRYAWVGGENDNLFWYNTGIAPIFTYLLLTGDREPIKNGVMQKLLRAQEILISGRQPDWALNSASIGYLHKAAYLMQDGRYILYRNRTGVDLNVFRLGQSFWPEEHLKPKPPDDLVGKWTINYLPKPMWRARNSGLKFEESFAFGSFRSATDASGDFILIDGFNGASRNPYHAFAILELRIDGHTLLKGYRNQLITRSDGLVEAHIAMDAALKYHDVVGATATVVGEVPDAAYCNWRRTIAQRVGRYTLIVDDLTFREDSDNIEVQIKWEADSTMRRTIPAAGVLRLRGVGNAKLPPGWHHWRSLDVQCTTNLTGPRSIARLNSLGITLLRSERPGCWIDMPFKLKEKVGGEVFVELLNYRDRGVVRMFLDGKPAGKEYNHYTPRVSADRVSLGQQELDAGEHRLRVETVAAHPESGKCYVGLIGVSIRPDGASPAQRTQAFDICLSDPAKTTLSGAVATMQWLGTAKKGEHKIFFSTIARSSDKPEFNPICVRLADNAAALALPSALPMPTQQTGALAVVGNFQGVKAELAVVEENHIYGKGITEISPGSYELDLSKTLIAATSPIDVDWDLGVGKLHIVASKDTSVRLALASSGSLRLNGKQGVANRIGDGLTEIKLSSGRYVLEGAKLDAARLKKMTTYLAGLLPQGEAERLRAIAAAQSRAKLEAPPLKRVMAANVVGKVVDLITIPSDTSDLICAAEGKTIHILSPDGKELRTLKTEGSIRMLRWWKEYNLLLAGCADEHLIAFDQNGKRKWVFTSKMDPAVFRAAKTYWFKSAPGHEGIHGLYTGVFLNGRSQAFVGSACTLEILDENGKLIKRMPQFWGKVSHFAIVDGPNGTLNLLASRKYNGTNTVAIINNKTLDPNPRGFYSVPPGHTYMPGWSSMNRHHLFYEDLDGDGAKEVISEINGTWNRVTVWSVDGKALYDVSFGPGERIPAKNMRDIDICDLNGDGKKEILAATSAGLVVALDYQCRKIWATRLPNPPTVMKCVVPKTAKTPWIIIGCEDGTVAVLDAKGKLIRLNNVSGRPTCIETPSLSPDGSVVLLATNKGEIVSFMVGE